MAEPRARTNHAIDEETPLLGMSGKLSGNARPWHRLRKHANAPISKDWADAVLLFCYIITGLLDSSAVFIWGSFVSMQTGNTIYLGLGIAAPKDGVRWIKAIVSISFFCLGSFFFSRFHRLFPPRRRWVFVVSYTLQLILIALSAAFVTFASKSSDELHWTILVPLALVAFQSSGQAVTSRVLQYTGLTSVVLTSVYCDLFSDSSLLALSNVERNRRTAAPILLFLGAVWGGLWAHSSVGLEGALWTAVVLKFMVVIAWMFWKTDTEEEE
ncbi:hypothetical protein EJ04DRAFT_436151 [Polyplosphaeria fusca]|uniref:DUF1275 domain protein n=1 Tax=Polyplosphaeria fusca TaxID=682080 RepID=A0A9P4R162_9PLEO|nr:hypothetical protein EJ04DRAFT_436151 [Polyplosphaeria fusca]